MPAAVATMRALTAQLVAHHRLYDYAHQPAHPDDWVPVRSRDLDGDAEAFQMTSWLWQMTQGRWHTFTHYTPAMRQLVYFENVRDACAFKIVWGGQ